MTIPLWCLLITMIIPLALAGVGGYFRTTQLGGIDNNDPREEIKQLSGPGARAYAAQSNAWEALALFTVAVLTAHVLNADPGMSATLAMAFVACRVLHPIAYIAGWGIVRSLLFIGALVSLIWLFLLGG